jgi:hypothetical protein
MPERLFKRATRIREAWWSQGCRKEGEEGGPSLSGDNMEKPQQQGRKPCPTSLIGARVSGLENGRQNLAYRPLSAPPQLSPSTKLMIELFTSACSIPTVDLNFAISVAASRPKGCQCPYSNLFLLPLPIDSVCFSPVIV